MLSVCLCARYQANPKESHLIVVKRIIKYLKVTTNVCLLYPKGNSLSLIGFSDSDFAGCKLDRRNTSGTCHFLGVHLYLGISRSKLVRHYPLLKHNTLQLDVVVLKVFR